MHALWPRVGRRLGILAVFAALYVFLFFHFDAETPGNTEVVEGVVTDVTVSSPSRAADSVYFSIDGRPFYCRYGAADKAPAGLEEHEGAVTVVCSRDITVLLPFWGRTEVVDIRAGDTVFYDIATHNREERLELILFSVILAIPLVLAVVCWVIADLLDRPTRRSRRRKQQKKAARRAAEEGNL